jgi:hypothetical protein
MVDDLDGVSDAVAFVAKAPLARQHFFLFVYNCPRVLLGAQTLGKLFSF